ncbi:MAG: cell division inhibitor SepF [Bacillota bacterium]|jgi:cell division inhibitor SepF|nr:cell division inhibitor SepF [Bacillota bacterium]MDK2855860.1 cell division inhibitor SepF [Bacillota bacterium]MDK2883079.1 cell division inhibitor SepF [Bacillota bacterium]MDK2925144.1 cell division inhibitor SepF [Bacillota bacterium]
MTEMPDLWEKVRSLIGKRGVPVSGPTELKVRLDPPPSEVRVVVRRPTSFAEAESIAAQIKAGQAVVLNLEGLALETAQRLVDYLSGVTYGLDGNQEKVGASIFLFTPPGVNIHVRDLLRGFEPK